jgi:phosphate uptake regulator
MDIRNIQRTGKMYYVYLPTAWCKKHNVDDKTKVSLKHNNDGTLTINPTVKKENLRKLELTINEDDEAILHKLIVACYLNPTSSFKITLGKDLSFEKLLRQKKQISLELVEVDQNTITCDSSVHIDDVSSLLKTMMRKTTNLIIVMTKQYNEELIHRYEEEIDRTRMLIEKSVINSLTFSRTPKLNTIDLYYVSLVSKDLERFVDTLIRIEEKEKEFLLQLLEIITFLKNLTEEGGAFENLNYLVAIECIKKVENLKEVKIKDIKTYDKKRIKQILSTLTETLMDWAITKELSD